MLDVRGFGGWKIVCILTFIVLPLVHMGEYFYNKKVNLVIAQLNVKIKTNLLSSILFSKDQTPSDQSTYISVFTNDLKLFEDNFEKIFFDTLMYGFMFIFSSIYALWMNPSLGTIFIAFTLITVLIPYFMGRNISTASMDWSKRNNFFISSLKDVLRGIDTIKSYGIERTVIERVKAKNKEMELANASMNNQVSKSDITLQCVYRWSFILPILIGIYMILKGTISVSELMAIAQVSNSIGNGFISCLENMNQMRTATPVYHKLTNQMFSYPMLSSESNDNKRMILLLFFPWTFEM